MPLEFEIRKIDDLAMGFADKAPFEVMKWVFTRFPQSEINSFTSVQLNSLLNELMQNERVLELRRAIATEMNQHGIEGLEVIGSMMAGFLPINHLQRVYGKSEVATENLDEIVASCANCKVDVAKGNFEKGTLLENLRFKPGNVFYSKSLAELFDLNGEMIHQDCIGNNFIYRKTANVSIYRRGIKDKSEITDTVRRIIQGTADSVVSDRDRGRKYRTMEKFIADRLKAFFPNASSSRGIDALEMYHVFEWAYRQNIDLRQFGFNDKLSYALMESIAKNMVPIYGIITSRLKSLERIFEKSLEVIYDSKREEDVKREGRKRRILADVYGVKIVVGSEQDCYRVKDAITKAFSLAEDPDDSIRMGRERKDASESRANPSKYSEPYPQYRAIALKIKTGTANIEVQILTHEMDRVNETSPNLSHRGSFEHEKRIRLAQFPWQTKSVVGVLLGYYGN